MLATGEIDALYTARMPSSFVDGAPGVVRLFADSRATEEAYFAQTGIFPIMHVVALRRDVFEQHRWLAMNLLRAFDEAKNRSVARARDATASFFPLPWTPHLMERSSALLGADPWPYGVDANRTTLEAFAQYAFEQGVCARRIELDELFPQEVRSSFKI